MIFWIFTFSVLYTWGHSLSMFLGELDWSEKSGYQRLITLIGIVTFVISIIGIIAILVNEFPSFFIELMQLCLSVALIILAIFLLDKGIENIKKKWEQLSYGSLLTGLVIIIATIVIANVWVNSII